MPSPDELQRMVVHAALPCRRCGQLLTGLPVSGECPECGLPIESSLRSTIDLASLDGEPLRHPRRTAVSLLLLAAATSGIILSTLIGAVSVVGMDRGDLLALILLAATASSGGLMIGGLALLCAGTAEDPNVAPRLLRWTLALAVTSLAGICIGVRAVSDEWATILPLGRPLLLADLLLGVAGMLAVVELSHLLRMIGARSETYRSAGQGLQPAGPMITGLGIQLLLSLLWLGSALKPAWAAETGPVLGLLRLVVNLMLAVGALYITVNTIWAIRPLLRARHRWSDLVGPDRPASMADRPGHRDTE